MKKYLSFLLSFSVVFVLGLSVLSFAKTAEAHGTDCKPGQAFDSESGTSCALIAVCQDGAQINHITGATCPGVNIDTTTNEGPVCINGQLFDEKTGVATGASCAGSIKLHAKPSPEEIGKGACNLGAVFNPITGTKCPALPANHIIDHDDSDAMYYMFCGMEGVVYESTTGKPCAAPLAPSDFKNSVAGYVLGTISPSIKQNSTGRDVDVTQNVMANLGLLNTNLLKSNGSRVQYGTNTSRAIKEFQRIAGLTVDGKMGPQTTTAMKAVIARNPEVIAKPVASKIPTKAQVVQKITQAVQGSTGSNSSSGSSNSSSGSTGGSSSGTSSQQTLLNPVDGGAGTAGDIAGFTCVRKDKTQWAPIDTAYTMRVTLGSVGHRIYATGPVSLYVFNSNDGPTEPRPKLKLLAGSGTNGLLFTFVNNNPPNGFVAADFDYTLNPNLEIEGAENLHTLSPDGTKYYPFDISELNSALEKCQMPQGGDGTFRGVVGGDGSIGGGGNVGGGNTGGGGNGGGGNPPSCSDGIQNQDETGVDTGGVCGGGNTGGGGNGGGGTNTGGEGGNGSATGITTTGGYDPHVSGNGQGNIPCTTPVGVPCHRITTGPIWPNPTGLKIGNNLKTDRLDILRQVVADWNMAPQQHLTIEAGNINTPVSENSGCGNNSSRIEICEKSIPGAGWVGVAYLNFWGGQMISSSVVMNEYYLRGGTSGYSSNPKYNSTAWYQSVLCQEIGHALGLSHNDENFGNANSYSCQDYGPTPTGNEHPHARDLLLVSMMYNPNSQNQSSIQQSISSNSNIPENVVKNVIANSKKGLDLGKRSTWGTVISSTADGKYLTHYEKVVGTYQGKDVIRQIHAFPAY